MIARRAFIRGLIAAPAVVAASSLMPIRLPSVLRPNLWQWPSDIYPAITLDDYARRILDPMIRQYQKKIAEYVLEFGTGPVSVGLSDSGEFQLIPIEFCAIAEATPTITL
jgi:hypothetical protein